MKKFLYTLAFALGMNATFAQTTVNKKEMSPEIRAEKTSQKWSKELGLSVDQKDKVKSIIINRINNMNALRAKNLTDKKAFHKEAKSINENFENDLKGTLSTDQFQKYMAFKEKMKKKHKEKKQTKSKVGVSDDVDEMD